jgi:chorismate synthase
MGGNSFGTIFRITTFGESHGEALGVVIDGCPAGLNIDTAMIQKDLDRRRPGAHAPTNADGKPTGDWAYQDIGKLNPASTSRKEADSCEILSGVFEGKTTGTPIAILIRNTSQRSADYGDIAQKFRPGHADFTYFQKYGIRDYRGGGRSSGRETSARVAAGAVAKALLATAGIHILAWTAEAAGIACETFDENDIEKNSMRSCDSAAAEKMTKRIIALKEKGDSAGGIVSCRITGCPAGLGEPAFDKLDAELARAMLSIGAVKGIEFGSGFESARMTGSEWNDPMRAGTASTSTESITMRDGSSANRPSFGSNHAGGMLGGISTSQDITFRIAIKPVPSISVMQKTVDVTGAECDIVVNGRHDTCLCPRIVPVAEAMSALVIADLMLRNRASRA